MYPVFIFIQSYPQYVKKAELETYLQKQAKGARLGIILGAIFYILTQTILNFLVTPRLTSLYSSLNLTQPAHFSYLFVASAVLDLVVIAVAAMTDFLDPKKVNELKQSKEDLITIKGSLVNKKWLLFILGTAAAFLFTVVLNIIFPIYSLTNSVPTQ